jgi:hypothetical protein
MHTALWFLFRNSALNAFKAALRRMRQPKYALGAIIGLLWLASIGASTLIPLFLGKKLPSAKPFDPQILDAFSVGLTFLILTICWVARVPQGTLSYTEAEANTLFSSPLGRRDLLAYHLLRSQRGLLWLGLILTITGLSRLPGAVSFWRSFLVFWVGANVVVLHLFCVGMFVRHVRKSAPWVVDLLRVGAFFLIMALIWAYASRTNPSLFVERGIAVAPDWLWMLRWPGKSLATPLFSREWLDFLSSGAVVLAVWLVHFLWASNVRIPWEEATLHNARRREYILSSMKQGKTLWEIRKPLAKAVPTPALAAHGWKGAAFIWKWVIQRGGIGSLLRTYGLFFIIFGTACLLLPWLKAEFPALEPKITTGVPIFCGIFGYIMVLTLLFVTPIKTAQNLRVDLNHSEILLTIPIPPRDAIVGTIIGPLIHAFALWLIGFLGFALLLQINNGLFTQPQAGAMDWASAAYAGLLSSIFLGLGILCTSTLVQVLLVLYFPAWQPAQSRAKGSMDNMGVGCLSGLGLLMLLALNFAAAGGIGFLAYRIMGIRNPLQTAAFSCTAFVILVALETWILLKLCIGAWRRYDPTEKSAGIGNRK